MSSWPTTNFNQMRRGVKKNQIFSNVSILFSNVSIQFSNIFERFQRSCPELVEGFERFLHEHARLMRKSALLIEILTLLRINSCPADLSVRSPDGIGTKSEALAKADARLIDFFSRQDGLRHSRNCLSCPFLALPQVTIWATCIT